MYIIVSVLVFIIAVLLILVILVQNPKGGLASNFSSSNQVMGVRKTTDFLEKATWTLGIALIVLSILSSATINRNTAVQIDTVESELQGEANQIVIPASQAPMTSEEVPADPSSAPTD
jgi:preprotein translocase subunit SecG